MNRSISPALSHLPKGIADRVADAIRRHRSELILFGVLGLVQVLTIAHHTSWRDEHQAWLMALGSRSLPDLWANLRYEGHPPLWHLLLWISQQVSTGFGMLKLTQACVALATLAVIVFFSPFPLAVRAMVGLNYFVIYEYGAFARSYALGALLVFCALAAWKNRAAWLLLALAAFASLHFLLLAGALGLYRLIRRGLDLPGAAVLGAGCLLSLYFLWPHPDTVRPVFIDSGAAVAMRTVLYSGVVLWPLTPLGGWFHFLSAEVAAPLAIASAFAIWLVIPKIFKGDAVSTALALTFLAGMTFLAVVAYPLYPRHASTLVLLVLGLGWVNAADGGALPPAFRGFTAWLAWIGVAGIIAAGTTNFSAGNLAVREIAKRGLQDETWVTYPAWHSLDIAALTGRPALSLQQGCLQTFQIWNFPVHHLLDQRQLSERLKEVARARGGAIKVMSSEDLSGLSGDNLRVDTLFISPRDQIGEVARPYHIVVPGAAPKDDAPTLPVCAAGSTRAEFARR